jgi:hypothetical protein
MGGMRSTQACARLYSRKVGYYKGLEPKAMTPPDFEEGGSAPDRSAVWGPERPSGNLLVDLSSPRSPTPVS